MRQDLAIFTEKIAESLMVITSLQICRKSKPHAMKRNDGEYQRKLRYIQTYIEGRKTTAKKTTAIYFPGNAKLYKYFRFQKSRNATMFHMPLVGRSNST